MLVNLDTNRAWIEVNLKNLAHNLREIQKVLSPMTKVMAVVKANAYGHGAVKIATKLNELGIFDFAVATLDEGIELRKNNIKGNILILGYTSIFNLSLVVRYDLIQTIVDEAYALEVMRAMKEQKIKVHVKVNTGMNRLGISYENVEAIKKIYRAKQLDVLGIYSHFCVADSKLTEDISFSNLQKTRFDTLISLLKNDGYNVGKVHLQSSYGILNYKEDSHYDYVRPGIILYGVHSDTDVYKKTDLSLLPVLSIKARVTSLREIEAEETVSYGRCYEALKKEKIATVSIGYADGYPRSLSLQGAKVRINGGYASIIGRICMDQLMIRVSPILQVKPGDEVLLIGENPEVTLEEVAKKAGTISNEILSRLGKRLPIIYK